MSTITGNLTQPVTIGSGGYTSPLTIAAGATVAIDSFYAAIYSSTPASVTNLGTVVSTYSYGIQLSGGGSVANAGTASLIEGYFSGVSISGSAGTVTNLGTILAGSTYATAGVSLGAGGSVDNSGTASLIEGYSYGVEISGGAGTVTNAGTIEGGSGIVLESAGAEATNSGTVLATGSGGNGIALYDGGSVYNGGAGALVEAANDAILVEGATGTVTNAGTLKSRSGFAVALDAGGTFDNKGDASGGVYLGASGTVVNSGTIAAGSKAVFLADGGVVNNTSSIAGQIGVYGLGSVSLVNSGLISAKGHASSGVYLYAGGVTNSGIITAKDSGSAGIILATSGTITNTGTVASTGLGGAGIVLYAGGNVYNSGTASLIKGAVGVYDIAGTGTVTNGGVIAGSEASGTGVDLAKGGTVVDSGAISGVLAVYLGGSGNNLLELDPGASISGSVVAKGTSNLLELTSAAATGTLSGLSEFTGFDQVTINAGAVWRMSGSDPGLTASNNGTILVEGGDTLVLGAVSGSGTVSVASFGTVEFAGAVATGQTFVFSDATDTLQLGDANAFAATIKDFRPGDIIDLFGQAATKLAFSSGKLKVFDGQTLLETLQVSGSFKTHEFALQSDGHGGTEITLKVGAASASPDVVAGIGTGPPDWWTLPG